MPQPKIGLPSGPETAPEVTHCPSEGGPEGLEELSQSPAKTTKAGGLFLSGLERRFQWRFMGVIEIQKKEKGWEKMAWLPVA